MEKAGFSSSDQTGQEASQQLSGDVSCTNRDYFKKLTQFCCEAEMWKKNDDATTAKLRRPREKCSPVTGGRRWSLQVSPRANQDLEQPRGRRHCGGAPANYRHQLEVAQHFSSSRFPRRVPTALDVLLDRRISIVWTEVFIWTR